MRQGIVAASGLLLALTMGSWIIVDPATTGATVSPTETTTTTVASTTTGPAPSVTSTTLPRPVLARKVATVPPDKAFLDELNGLRVPAGLDPLIRDDGLDARAQSWVDTMVGNRELRHSKLIYEVIEGSWITAGENVGYGPTTAIVFEAFVESRGHRSNMVNADFTHVGIGVARVDGVLWTAHLFAG